MKLKDKVAIVTGAAGAGIGQATVHTLAKEGASVVVSDAHARRPFSVAEEISASLGVKALGVQCDVSNSQDVENMVNKTLEEFGKIDILVNNAGINRVQPVVEMSDETWDLVMNVNLRGTFYCSRAVLPTMIKRKSGKIVNLASIAGWLGLADDGAAYCTAKAGIVGFTKTLAHEVAPHNIRVNAIAPGLIFNEFLLRIYSQEYVDDFKKNVPLGRNGEPQDIANAVLFLVSEEAGFITGETLCVSGGMYMH